MSDDIFKVRLLLNVLIPTFYIFSLEKNICSFSRSSQIYTFFRFAYMPIFLFYLFLSHACALWLSHHIILSSFQKISFFYHLIHRPSEYSIVYNGSDTQLEDAVSISQTYFDKSCVSFLFFFFYLVHSSATYPLALFVIHCSR